MMKLPPQVNTAFEMLEAAGYEAYLVGGAVRDYVRDNSPAKDWDITTNALPEQVEEIFTGCHLIETVLSPIRCKTLLCNCCDRPRASRNHDLSR